LAPHISESERLLNFPIHILLQIACRGSRPLNPAATKHK
jgi:hypothetical protein